jgi:RNA polymerase sigma-70 factor (ECF subfamily)
MMNAETRFRALFDTAYPALRRYARARGLEPADADDLVAEVLTIAWRRLDDVPADDPLPWLFATARNVWRNHLRSTRRRAELTARVPAATTTAPPPEPGAHSVTDILEALAQLSDDDQEILRLAAWDGLTTAQLARTFSCNEGTARVRLHRARQRLAACLENSGNDKRARDRSSANVPTEGTSR